MQQALFDLPDPPMPTVAPPAGTARRPSRRSAVAADAQQRWWRLQGRARREGRAVEPLLVTPRLMARIDAASCPVTREPMAPRSRQAVPLRDDADVAAGHLATLGPVAAAAVAAGPDWAGAWALAEQLARDGGQARGLGAADWRRLAVLKSFVQPLTPAQAATLPLCVLPPPRLRVLSPVQSLQVVMTLALTTANRVDRLMALIDSAGDAEPRVTARVFVLTLLARCPSGLDLASPACQRTALEDLWGDELLQRRWHRLAGRLDDAQAGAWLRRARALWADDRRWRPLAAEVATQGWSLGH
jgi:hypothetical protein